MPELPEVESIRRQLEPLILGKTLIDSYSFSSKKFEQAKLASGFHIEAVNRRGKYLIITLENELAVEEKRKELIIHLGMTGSCLLYTSPSPRDLSTSRMPSSA